MGKTFVIGDIHGAGLALKQCLLRAQFSIQSDTLICLGDVCDGWPDTRSCIDQLMNIQRITYLLGNHDAVALQWMRGRGTDDLWLTQGGQATIDSYRTGLPANHISFLATAKLYLQQGNKLFVHAGINPRLSIEKQTIDTFLWDRTLAHAALSQHEKQTEQKLTSHYDEIYIGHTPIMQNTPLFSGGVWLMDTGAGWSGVLSMMNIETKEVFSSDPVPQLYPDHPGRRKR